MRKQTKIFTKTNKVNKQPNTIFVKEIHTLFYLKLKMNNIIQLSKLNFNNCQICYMAKN